ncbi:hypothetical protein BJ322DRAFT_90657 [Thelephora terrestris]|uniref:F-box domain-containing protein n=1 Tax=Thelephora terrestris TaxID=56493 RepID=A0A9P6HQQ5_9AGAM|nr:hypothetical protein BJ322DRAFT_90657 [Thelephora terrestris]
MHPCLLLDDILRLVAVEIINLERPSAVSFACTCRAIEASVMGVLWGSYQNDLINLFRCFPSEVWEIRESDSSKLYFDFKRHPSPPEWERVNRYASWMRTLIIYEDSTCPSPSSRAWRELRALRPADLLPNLRSLEWYSAADTFVYINLFLSPRLTSLNVHVVPDVPNVGPILDFFPVETLEELRFQDSSGDRAVQDAISKLVLKTTAALRSIVVSSDLSDAAIQHVTRLPNLSDASVTFANLDRLSVSPDAGTFPLRTLETRVDGAGGWKYLLHNVKNLDSAVLFSSTVFQPEEIVAVFGFLIDKGFHQTLRRLFFAVQNQCDLTPQVLAPLHKFESLTTLSVTSFCGPIQCKSRLTNEALAQLAEALPQLVKLFLGAAPCATSTGEITLAGLRPLSTHCIHLETLQIHFSAFDIPSDIPDDALSSPSDQEPPGPNHCHLSQLVVGALPVSTSENSLLIVAYFLHQLFPRLSDVVPTVPNSPWKRVQEHINTFQKYRPKK